MLNFQVVVNVGCIIKTSLNEGLNKKDVDKEKVFEELNFKDCWGKFGTIKDKKVLKVEGCLSDIVKEWFNKKYPDIKILQ